MRERGPQSRPCLAESRTGTKQEQETRATGRATAMFDCVSVGPSGPPPVLCLLYLWPPLLCCGCGRCAYRCVYPSSLLQGEEPPDTGGGWFVLLQCILWSGCHLALYERIVLLCALCAGLCVV